MRRRQLLAALAAGATAGCGGSPDREGDGEASPTDRQRTVPGGANSTSGAPDSPVGSTPTVDAPTLAEQGFPPDVCETDVIADFSIRAIDDPAFAPDWSGIDPAERYGTLTDGSTVVGVERGGRARAYPVSVLWVHEVVNDRFGGPTLVTYCSLCLSGLVAERRVRGEPATFGVSGQLWRPPRLHVRASEASGRAFAADRGNWTNRSAANESPSGGPESIRVTGNLVMYDESTRSYWSQVLGRAICGPMTGTRLPVLASTVTTWGEWHEAHPETDVLLPAPASGTM